MSDANWNRCKLSKVVSACKSWRQLVSDAAEQYVKACRHPKVKGGARALFEAIAQLIPEGQTTTPLIGMKDLALAARLHRVTVVSRLRVLVDIKAVDVLDGGQGIIARYRILEVAGAPPIVNAALPLRADLRPVPPRHVEIETPPDLFGPIAAPATENIPEIHLLRSATSVLVAIGYKLQTTLAVLVAIGYKYAKQAENVLVAIGYKWFSLVAIGYKYAPQGVDDARARDVHTSKNTHTSAAPRDGPPTPDDEQARAPDRERRPPASYFDETNSPRRIGARDVASASVAPPVHPWHAWCGRVVCVPKELHDDWLRKGHERDWLFAFYARRYAAIPPGEKITVNDFTFWRTALKDELRATTKDQFGGRSHQPPTRRGAAPLPIYDYDDPDAVAKRQRKAEADAWLEARSREASAAIDAMTPEARAELHANAAEEFARFKGGMTAERYEATVRGAMVRLVVDERMRERKSG